MRVSRFLSSNGVRLAFIQAVLLITVFAVATSMTKVSVKSIYRHELQTRILGVVATLSALDRDKGAAAAARAVAQEERQPGGLEYRLEDRQGRALSGDLPATGARPGWTYLDWDDQVVRGRPYQDLLVYTQPLADGSILTVGRDLSDESKLRHALARTLFWWGAVGAACGLGLSYLFARGPLQRVHGVVSAARAVSQGQLQIRAPTRKALLPDDIDDLGASFNTMLDEIATLVSRVRWVSTDIAHDLRTPLSHVLQKLERIKGAAGADAEVLAGVQAIEADVEELLRTFDAMLRLAEIENDPTAARRRPVDLMELTNRVASAYAPDVEEAARTLQVSASPATLHGDADLLGHAIANLIENALRHTPPGSRITVRAETVGDRAMLSVTDNGPGIPSDRRDAVLQRFFRLEASRSTPGSGLGLPIVAAIAKRHGATLSLADAGPGLTATLLFPPPAP